MVVPRFGKARAGMWGVCFVALGLYGCAEKGSSAGLLLEFTRTGGFAGESTELRLFEDGRAAIVQDGDRRYAKLRTTTLEDVTELADEARFGSLRERYLSPAAADVFRYEITYESFSVVADDPALPDSLIPLVDCLGRVVAAGPKGDDGALPVIDCPAQGTASGRRAVAPR